MLNYRLILTLRNRHVNERDLFNSCNTLEIHVELISLRNDCGTNWVEHYGKEYDENTIWVWLKDIISYMIVQN